MNNLNFDNLIHIEDREIIYNNNKIILFKYNKDIYFRATDICNLLDYSNCLDAINSYVDKDNILKQSDTIFVNEFGLFSLISSSKLSEIEIKNIKNNFIKQIIIPIHKAYSYDKLITIEKEKTKQAELEKEIRQLEIRRQELELEILKLKNNTQYLDIAKDVYISENITAEDVNKRIKPKTKKCADCNNMIYNQSTRCHKCLTKFRLNTAIRVNNRPTLEQLEEDLLNSTYVNVGKKYNVSDNTIRSWIKQYKKEVI